MFKVGDVIQQSIGGAKYRVVLVDENQHAYKVFRLDNGQPSLIGIDKDYVLTDPPPNETTFQRGQVLLQKLGRSANASICIILKCYPAVDSKYNMYDVMIIYEVTTRNAMKATIMEHELLKDFTTKSLTWLLVNGSPLRIAQEFLEGEIIVTRKEIQQKEKKIKETEDLMADLKFFEKKEENENHHD